MNEDDLSSIGWRPFGTKDAKHWVAHLGRCAPLAEVLWGRNPADLERQLERSIPEMPVGFEIADYRFLFRLSSQYASLDVSAPRNAWLRRLSWEFSGQFRVGREGLTPWQARHEIVLRAIEYLEES